MIHQLAQLGGQLHLFICGEISQKLSLLNIFTTLDVIVWIHNLAWETMDRDKTFFVFLQFMVRIFC